MKTLGFDKPLYILPFDHRGSFQTKMFGWDGALRPQQTAEIAAAKRVIYDAFKAAVARRRAQRESRHSGRRAVRRRDSSRRGTRRLFDRCPAEKSGQDEFDFEYGDDFAEHIEAFQPTFCKVLVRYNPEGDRDSEPAAIGSSEAACRTICTAARASSRFMFELLVPAEKAQLDQLKGDKKAYDLELRPRLMAAGDRATSGRWRRAGRMEDRGTRPARGLREIVAAARRDGRNESAASFWAAARTTRRFANG